MPTASLFLPLLLLACGNFEGDDPGECTDGADNDRDGDFDCDDDGCEDSPDCEDEGGGSGGPGSGSGDGGSGDSGSGDSGSGDSGSGDSGSDDTGEGSETDADGDGQDAQEHGGADCNDADPWTYAGAAEAEDAEACMTDADEDGWGAEEPAEGATAGTDCNDGLATVNPGASDGVFGDRNCDGEGGDGDLTQADAILLGTTYRDRAGRWLQGVGDIDGDGLGDVLVSGQPDEDRGRAWLVLGKNLSGSISLDDADIVLTGEEEGDKAGWTTAAGDLDGDGVPDLIIGAPHARDSGAVYIIYGSGLTADLDLGDADVILEGAGSYSEAGAAVAAGDIDGDGRDDLLVGAPDDAGSVYVVLAPQLGSITSLSDAVYTLTGSHEYDGVGRTVALGDVDGDGGHDLIVGGSTERYPNGSARGTVHVVLASGLASGDLASAAAHSLQETDGKDDFAASLNTLDADGDGLTDILVGGGESTAGSGEAGVGYLFLASSLGNSLLTASSADHNFTGVGGESRASMTLGSVSSAGDVDGDGLDDVLVGAKGASSNEGSAHIVLAATMPEGKLHLLEADYTLVGDIAGDGAQGTTVAAAGDLNGDGAMDLLIGMPGADDNAEDAGVVYVVFGP